MNLTLPTTGVLSSTFLSVIAFSKSRATLVSIALLMLISIQTYGQDNDWKLLTTIDGVEVSYLKGNCEESEMLFIKTKNTTPESLSISYKYDFQIDGESVGSGVISMNDLAGQTELSGDCETGLRINVYDHLSMFDESVVTLTITKN